ncbi:hypothetical protein CJF42_23055 [Pseudoalteromonas sp. NBT06-2]|uniref:peptidase domain-containing ABC transporter n=1 Tax=Pseudoalteromonas sp. NBT06-2 TaxID=2025950 RepID=UPI000BA6811A|nr:peptidase domain-containing ABC transporter [Pseudoalteromonas sp. NBT06-2]PAJ72103.1 hypothetical protein CJF42_23055 [Pseudoalteromonas sp. NBT06-2]
MDENKNLLDFGGKRKLPLILQSEISECGLACVLMIASYFGYSSDLVCARRKFNLSNKGLTLEALIDLSEKIKLQARPLRAELSALKSFNRPVILHWDMSHFVVLNKVRGKYVEIFDPAKGKRTLTLAEVSNHFTGVVLELFPSADFQQCAEQDKVKLSDFWSKIHSLKGILTKIIILSFCLQIFVLGGPLIQQLVIDEAITMKDAEFLLVIVLGLAMIGIFQALLSYIRSKIILFLTNTLSFEMTSNLFKHLMRLPAEYFEKRRLGDITTRFGSLTPIQNIISTGVVTVILDGFMAITTLTVALYYSWTMTLLIVTFLIIGFLIQLSVYPRLRRQQEKIIDLSGKEQTAFIENIQAAITIKIFGQESNRENVWLNNRVDKMNETINLANFQLNLGLFTSFIGALQQAVVMFMSAMLVINNQITLGMLFAYQSYSGQFSSKIDGLITQYFAFKILDMHLGRLSDIVCEKREGGEATPTQVGEEKLKRLDDLTLKNIDFRYGENESYVLNNIHLDVQKGEMISIVGTSGAGKSTLLKIMLGLVKPSAGMIISNGIPLDNAAWKQFRQCVGVVMQNDKLLSGTIADNISFFDPNVDIEWVHVCAQKGHIYRDIMEMPMGFNTLIGDMGSSLSGGQKQRLLIARALYKKPNILFMDEGTANLDQRTENMIADTIRNMPITRIIIAHRPALIAISDRILELREKSLTDITEVLRPKESA